MRNVVATLAVVCCSMVVTVCDAGAHAYIPNNGTHVDAASAREIGPVNVSRVVYHEVTASSPRVWLRFEGSAGEVADIQLGVPKIDRFALYRPAFALVGPGLPDVADPAFDIPDGLGAFVFDTTDLEAPEEFHEEFTGTTSWVFPMQSIELPEDGVYYIVGYAPGDVPGKLWVAPGTLERFGVKDILSLPWVIYKVRTFHEIFPFGGILAWGMLALVLLIVGILLA